jgi:hypothetical protein
MNPNFTELVAEVSKLKDLKGESLLSQDFNNLIAQGLHHCHLPPTLHPKAAEAFQTTFELMGGLPRMLLWADQHPASFYKLFARMVVPTITPVLPTVAAQKEEWPPWLTARRLAYQEAGFVADDSMDTDE